MRRLFAFACVLALAFSAGVITPAFAEDEAQPETGTTTAAAKQPELGRYLLAKIARYRRETWRWEKLMRAPRSSFANAAARSNDPEFRRAVLRMWRVKAAKRRRQASNPPRLRAWLCIKRYEASWDDPHPPYYGGLQMDLAFQRTYGPELLRQKGTADRWLPIEQMWVAERAYSSGRGFTPWPNTARSCGFL